MSEIPEKIGKYKIIREIGRGATAVVYLAEHPHYPERVAVKHVRFKDKAKDEAKWNRRLLKLLRAEGAVAKRLDHPSIIRIFEAVIDTDEAYVVMEYFPADSLERYCSFENLLPVHRAIGIVFKCCMALDHAYMRGVVHRDIKPANILVDDQDNVKITDFGLAMNINKKMDTDSTFIMGVGSPAYMSPEQIKSYPLNQKTDLYSLGVVLFHLLTGRLPFRASNPAQLVYKIINVDPPSVCQLNPDLPAAMDIVIRKSLAKDLYSRYKNGADFAKDLSAVRYKLVEDKDIPPDLHRFEALRKLTIFTEFDDIDVWEVLRMSSWRKAEARALIYKEGDEDQRFGIVLEGSVELSVAGRKVRCLEAGEVFGELAWLDGVDHRHMLSVISVEPTTYLEISPSALTLASDEVREGFRNLLSTLVAKRLGDAAREIASHGEPALEPDRKAFSALSLKLTDD
ncbi:MAG: serine/threonine-protein kinase [Rhodocyclaceae bacterium]|jgi:non-specific serine/threonine protein kinase|nr:serine/threonine-protein kinase [Rhodocyclaceae bacterium]